jgi:hypothetical protein
MDGIKEPELEKRKPDKSIIPLDGYSLSGKKLDPSTTDVIEPGGIVQLKFRGSRIGVKITKAAGNEFVGRIFLFESPNKVLEGLSLDGFIKFREENIFGYDPPMKDWGSRKPNRSSSKS